MGCIPALHSFFNFGVSNAVRHQPSGISSVNPNDPLLKLVLGIDLGEDQSNSQAQIVDQKLDIPYGDKGL